MFAWRDGGRAWPVWWRAAGAGCAAAMAAAAVSAAPASSAPCPQPAGGRMGRAAGRRGHAVLNRLGDLRRGQPRVAGADEGRDARGQRGGHVEEASGSYPPPGAAAIRPAAGLAVRPPASAGSGVVPEPGAVSATNERVLVNGASWPVREVAPTAMTPG